VSGSRRSRKPGGCARSRAREHARAAALGRSDQLPGPLTFLQMGRDTALLMDALAIDCAHVLGGSMGGIIARQNDIGLFQ